MPDSVPDTTSEAYNSSSESSSSDTSDDQLEQYSFLLEVPSDDFDGEEIFYIPIILEHQTGTSDDSSTLEESAKDLDLKYEDFEKTKPTNYEEGSVYTIPLFLELNLIPGEVWPMDPKFRDVGLISEWALKQLPFGACLKINENGRTFGTIAVISSDADNKHIALIGHQRFEVLEVLNEGFPLSTDARVKIIKDTTLYYPMKTCSDSKIHHSSHGRMCSKRVMFQTQWPSWVYKQFDVHDLASNISKKLKILSENIRISDNPIFLSFQVTKLGIFNEEQITELLGIESTNLRLQRELHFINNLNVLEEYICAGSDCGVQICYLKTVLSMTPTKPHESNCEYWNTSRNMVTVSNLEDYVNKITFVNKSTECSCFPGYNGTSIICKTCKNHLGWRFLVKRRNSLTPTSFFALSLTALTKKSVKIDPNMI